MINDSRRAQCWVEMPAWPSVLAKNWAAVAKWWLSGGGGEYRGSRNRCYRYLWDPLWATWAWRVAKVCRLCGPMSPIYWQVDWQGSTQPISGLRHGSGGHSGHFWQEAAETRWRSRWRGWGDSVCCGWDVKGRTSREFRAALLTVTWLWRPRNAITARQSIRLSFPFATEVSIVKHLFAVGVQCPVVSFT